MARRLHTALNVTKANLSRNKIYNGFIDLDSPFYLDPALLRSTRIPELVGAHAHLQAYFTAVAHLLAQSQRPNDPLWRTAVRRLTFREDSSVALGYSANDAAGNAIGPELAHTLTVTAKPLPT